MLFTTPHHGRKQTVYHPETCHTKLVSLTASKYLLPRTKVTPHHVSQTKWLDNHTSASYSAHLFDHSSYYALTDRLLSVVPTSSLSDSCFCQPKLKNTFLFHWIRTGQKKFKLKNRDLVAIGVGIGMSVSLSAVILFFLVRGIRRLNNEKARDNPRLDEHGQVGVWYNFTYILRELPPWPATRVP